MELLLKFGVFLLLTLLGFWRGRYNEKRHLEEILAEEKRLAHITVFSSRYPPVLQQAMDPILLTGSTVVASDFFRMLLGSLRKVVGGNYRAYESLLERGRRQALIRLKQAAEAQGARMIFNVKFATARISDQNLNEAPQLEILAYGTAYVPATGSVRLSRAHHQRLDASALDEEDLLRNKTRRYWLWSSLIVAAGCVGALALDKTMTHSWRYVNGVPWIALCVVAVAIACGVGLIARKDKLSALSIGILGIISVPVYTLGLYFLALLINGMTATVQVVPYTVDDKGVLHAKVPGTGPDLSFPDVVEYWQEYPKTEPINMTLAKGWLGFYQYDFHPWREKYASFYQSYNARDKSK